MATTIIARLLGLVRDMLFYTWFGRSYMTDAYNAAFSIPDLLYFLLVGGALSSAFMPVFSSYLARNEEDEGWKVASTVFNFTILTMLVLIIIAEFNTRPLLLMLVPNLSPESINLAVTLTRVMFIQTFFMACNGLSWGVLNSKQHFTWPAIGSILYNLGIIAFGLALSKPLGIMGFAIGVVAGSILVFAVQIPALIKAGLRYYPSLDWRNPGFQQIVKLMLPSMLGLSVTQLNLFVTQYLASGLAAGSITALNLAQRIMQLPLSIFGISIAQAVFPTMNTQAAKNETEDFIKTFSKGIRTIFLITVPSGIGLIALREPIIGLLFQQGQFTAADTTATAWALLFYSLGLFAYSALQIVNRIFYSMKDTLTPVLTGIFAIVSNRIISYFLIDQMQHGGLALAYSLAGVINVLLLMSVLKWRLKHIDGIKILRTFAIASAASGIMYFAARGTVVGLGSILQLGTKLNDLVMVVAGIGVGCLVYGLIILLLKLEEGQIVLGMLKRKVPALSFLDRFGR